jgi:hypothetical protein
MSKSIKRKVYGESLSNSSKIRDGRSSLPTKVADVSDELC